MRIIFVLFLLNACSWGQTDSADSTSTEKIQSKVDTIQLNHQLVIGRTKNHHSLMNIAAQVYISPTVGSAFAVIPLCFAVPSSKNGHPATANFLGGLSVVSYVLGVSLAVHWLAEEENEYSSYWETAKFSGIGTLTFGGLAYSITRLYKKDALLPTYFAVVSGAVLGAVIYTNCIADWPPNANNASNSLKISSQKDVIEYSKLFDINIITFRF